MKYSFFEKYIIHVFNKYFPVFHYFVYIIYFCTELYRSTPGMMTGDIPKLHLLTLERVLGVDSPVVPNNEPVSSIWYNFPCAPIEDSDQPAHPRSLIRVFDGRSMDSKR